MLGSRGPARLGVLTCRADGDALGPAGVHLRWFVPRRLGLPPGGFDVWRVRQERWYRLRSSVAHTADLEQPVSATRTWSSREQHLALHEELTLIARADADLRPSPGGLVVERPGRGEHLLLHFHAPVLALSLVLEPRAPSSGERPPNVRVHHHAAILEERPLAERVDIDRPGITDVLLPTQLRRIRSIRFVTERSVAEPILRGDGEHLVHLEVPATAAAAYDLVGVDSGLRTRWARATSLAQLQARYPADRVAALVGHARATLGDPDRTLLTDAAAGRSPARVRVLDHLALASIDPVVARMLALLWVDDAPVDGLYLVRGDMADERKTTVDGWAFTAHNARPPRIDAPVLAQQLAGIDHRDGRPTGRVGLRWQRPPSRTLRPDRTVAVDVERTVRGVTASRTPRGPHLVAADATHPYTDAGVEIATEVTYAVVPVDVFGRTGAAVRAEPLVLRDLAAPVPPKAVRASVVQPGFPWSDPATRDAAAMARAHLHTTLELGEALRRASPDATTVRWLWSEGPHPADVEDPDAWHELAELQLGPPAVHAQVLAGAPHATAWPATVAAVRRIEPAEVAAAGARMLPAVRDAADRPATPDATTVELLLDTALLEPGTLAGHEVRLGALRAPVLSSHAGLAAAEDPHDDARMTARVAIADGELAAAVGAGREVVIAHPAAPGWSAQMLRDWLRVGAGPPGDLPPLRLRVPVDAAADGALRAVGGEVAIDVVHRLEPDPAGGLAPWPTGSDDERAQRRTVLGRLVGQRRAGDDELDVLLRLPRDGALLLLLTAATPGVAVAIRRHPPYRLPPVTLGLGGAEGDIPVAFAPEQRFTSLWISAVTVDAGGRTSGRVAPVAEARVVQPPPDLTPSAPYPENEGPDAAAGRASPPDAEGVATLAIAWSPLAGPRAAGARFEVARALDTSIVARDRSRWLRGGSDAHFAALGIVAGPHAAGTLRGSWRAVNRRTFAVTLDGDGAAMRAIGTGRVRIAHRFATGPRTLHHRLVRVVAGIAADGSPTTELLCAPQGPVDAASLGDVDEGAAVRVDAMPDHAAVRRDAGALRVLADLDAGAADANEQAFGIVSGTPVAADRFVDRLPGRGGNTVLYKIRAVFPGETRSAWSPASVGCRTLDLTRPGPPRRDHVQREGAATVHRIELPDAVAVTGVRLLRSPEDGGPAQPWRDLLVAAGGAADATLAPARIAATRTLLDLRGRSPDGPLSLDAAPRLTGVFEAGVDRGAPPADGDLRTDELRREVLTLDADVDGRALALRVERADGSVVWLDRVPDRHEIVLDDAEVAGHTVWAAVFRRVELPGRVIELHSEPVRLTGEAEAGDGG